MRLISIALLVVGAIAGIGHVLGLAAMAGVAASLTRDSTCTGSPLPLEYRPIVAA